MVFQVSKTAIALIAFCLSLSTTVYARTQNYSFYSDEPETYLKAIGRSKQGGPMACPDHVFNYRSGIVTHHLLAIDLMNEFFTCLSRNVKPKRIVLIGPDHYGQSRERIAVSLLPWKTPFGVLYPDPKITSTVKKSLGLGDDSEAFSGEHSIGVLVPFIRYYFPASKIVPIIVQRNVGTNKMIRLKLILRHLLDDPNTLILLSMDFSHNHTSDEADRRDELARGVIEKLDYEQTDKLDVDCHPGLKVLLEVLKERQGIQPRVLNHSNSAKLAGQKNLKNVTSYFTFLFEQR